MGRGDKVRFGVKTDRGMLREINEDNYRVVSGYTGIPAVLMVADGMGGHNAGEIASTLAVDFVCQQILQYPERFQTEEIPAILTEIASGANTCVFEKSKEQEAYYGMGTTLILAVIREKKLYIGHIGDSRVYLLREGKLSRITTDHSFVEELIKSGSLTREEAENHPKKNIITRALGCADEIETDLYSMDITRDDIFLICTDGLTNMLQENEIKEILETTDDPEDACEQLVQLANNHGGEDNITVIVFKNVE